MSKILTLFELYRKAGLAADLPAICDSHEALRAEVERLEDNPENDATDFAHPSWWRGEKYGSIGVARRLQQTIDGKDDGTGTMQPEIEKPRRDILALRARLEAAENVCEASHDLLNIKLETLQAAHANARYEVYKAIKSWEETKKCN